MIRTPATARCPILEAPPKGLKTPMRSNARTSAFVTKSKMRDASTAAGMRFHRTGGPPRAACRVCGGPCTPMRAPTERRKAQKESNDTQNQQTTLRAAAVTVRRAICS